MEQPQYLIDTNVIINYLGNKLPTSGMEFMNHVVDATPIVSVITKIEILGFNAPDEHYWLLAGFMNDATILDLTSRVVDISIEIRKKQKTKLPDVIIAATAMAHNLTLITCNTSDFKNLPELATLNPWEV